MKRLVLLIFIICCATAIGQNKKPIKKSFKIEVPNKQELKKFDWDGVKTIFAGLQKTDSISIGFKYYSDNPNLDKENKTFSNFTITTIAANLDDTIEGLKKLSSYFIKMDNKQKRKSD